MYKYKTKDGKDSFVPGVGQTVNGELSADHLIENPNIVLISRPDQAPEPAPTHLNGVVPQSAQPVVPPTQPSAPIVEGVADKPTQESEKQ